jgi:hypothetical protein
VLYSIARAVGLPPWAARIWPLGFEQFMASAALNALAEQRHRRHLPQWWQRVAWYPWTLTALTAGASLLLNWFHPAIPLDPPPGWLRSVVYGLPPLAAVFAWHLFLQRVTHRHHLRPAAPDACPSALDTLDGPADTTVARLDIPPASDPPDQAVDGKGVRALSASDTPGVHPPASDTPPSSRPSRSPRLARPSEPRPTRQTAGLPTRRTPPQPPTRHRPRWTSHPSTPGARPPRPTLPRPRPTWRWTLRVSRRRTARWTPRVSSRPRRPRHRPGGSVTAWRRPTPADGRTGAPGRPGRSRPRPAVAARPPPRSSAASAKPSSSRAQRGWRGDAD